jgi:putative tryptophan/tyrosine transport system substrate-binding protein
MKRRALFFGLGGMSFIAQSLHAQPKPVPVIGYLSSAKPGPTVLEAFYQGLAEAGYHEGQNVRIEYRWAEGQYDRLPEFAAE